MTVTLGTSSSIEGLWVSNGSPRSPRWDESLASGSWESRIWIKVLRAGQTPLFGRQAGLEIAGVASFSEEVEGKGERSSGCWAWETGKSRPRVRNPLGSSGHNYFVDIFASLITHPK